MNILPITHLHNFWSQSHASIKCRTQDRYHNCECEIERLIISPLSPFPCNFIWPYNTFQVTTYIAEFWNTVTNLWMILPPIHGLYCVYKNKFEKRYLAFAQINTTHSNRRRPIRQLLLGKSFSMSAGINFKNYSPPNDESLLLMLACFTFAI